jgi:hypothetical protein
MAVTIGNVRLETQISSAILSDEAVQYAIDKISDDNINLVCAEVLRMVKRKYAGVTRLTIGKYEEWRDLSNLQNEINFYTNKGVTKSGSVIDDGFTYPDPRFSEDGI